MSVLSAEVLASTPAQNYGDLMRAVPGLNVIQVMFETEIPNGITLSGVAQRLTRDTRVNPTSDNRNLGQEWGIAANYKYGANMTLDFCFAQLFPGTAIGLEPRVLARLGRPFMQRTTASLFARAMQNLDAHLLGRG